MIEITTEYMSLMVDGEAATAVLAARVFINYFLTYFKVYK